MNLEAGEARANLGEEEERENRGGEEEQENLKVAAVEGRIFRSSHPRSWRAPSFKPRRPGFSPYPGFVEREVL